MKPTVDFEGIKKTKAWEYALRFVFGGVVTAVAALVTRTWGPIVGGLFLGFPAILPASLTLVKQHDGRAQACDDARGGLAGSVGLSAFALVVWLCARVAPIIVVLCAGTVVWFAVSVSLWWLFHRSDRR
jgi:hypothetical protein